MKAIADLAHARGAYAFCDIVQAAGAVPIDVRAMGIDFMTWEPLPGAARAQARQLTDRCRRRCHDSAIRR